MTAAIWSEEAGPEGAPMIALVHGSMDRSAGLLKLSRRLDDDHRVLRYDRRGYGRSAPHPGPFGMDGQVGYDYTFRRPGDLDVTGSMYGTRYSFLRVRANSIEGGTSEIMRNILGEQVLGLPGEPRVDKSVPWSQVPRS